jgi:hypothetical protein
MRRIRSIALAALLILATLGAAAPATAATAVPQDNCATSPSSC